MTSRYKHPPISFRPPEGDRAWLLAESERTGYPVNAILREALTGYRVIARLVDEFETTADPARRDKLRETLEVIGGRYDE
jgi:hypothetical protein